MKCKYFLLIGIAALFGGCRQSTPPESTRAERRLITQGNTLYADGKYPAAMAKYSEALEGRPESAEARYNLGLSQIRRSRTSEADSLRQAFLTSAVEHTSDVARRGSDKPMVASRANYNLGNLAFEQEDYSRAIESYKQALRLNPSDEAARRNLRIAQLKQQQKDDNQDNNQDDQNRNQQKDQDREQNQNQQKDPNQQQDNNEQQPPQQDEQQINPQASDQILKAMENKENQTRARVMKGQNGREAAGGVRSRKNW